MSIAATAIVAGDQLLEAPDRTDPAELAAAIAAGDQLLEAPDRTDPAELAAELAAAIAAATSCSRP